AIETARAEVAALIGAQSDEIVFTSGGTEANNIAIRGAAQLRSDRQAILTTTIEHPATEECCGLLERLCHPVARGAPKGWGRCRGTGFSRGAGLPDSSRSGDPRAKRDRHLAAGCRDRPPRPLTPRACAYRRGAVTRQNSGGRWRSRRRSAVDRRPQALRPER